MHCLLEHLVNPTHRVDGWRAVEGGERPGAHTGQVKAQGAPLRWQCQTLSVLTTEEDLKFLRNALQGQGLSLPG